MENIRKGKKTATTNSKLLDIFSREEINLNNKVADLLKRSSGALLLRLMC
uniref:Uncharacterized protein n=1 Tax=Nelumbo nucifera TaxID=4432 RepID=A0A822Z043_NELNU|nr:TPA_asm: hypothetical protein HUJ06_014047 [Nelumbo nucifera]